jgi:hypothetical protein
MIRDRKLRDYTDTHRESNIPLMTCIMTACGDALSSSAIWILLLVHDRTEAGAG